MINYIRNPSLFFRFRSPRTRERYFNLRKSISPKVLKQRRKYIQKLPPNVIKIDPEKGFYKTDYFSDLSELKDSILYGNQLISEHLANTSLKSFKKNYLQSIYFDLSLDNPFFKLALNKELVSIASHYLGFVPILSNINLWYSPNDGSLQEGSQLYHLDWADVKQCKLFIPLHEIDEETGPTTFLSALESNKVVDAINYRLSEKENRVEDDIVYSIANKSEVQSAVGKPGEIFFCDSCRCFHYGSRKALKPRSLLMIQYLSPFSFTHPIFYKGKSKFSHLSSPDASEFEKMVIGAT